MAAPNILEHYLVSLSMKGPSSAEQREAEKAFSTLAEAVAAVIPAIAAAGTAIVYATDKIASGLGKLYFESQKTGATVREIAALGYAFEQNGSTLEKFHADFDKFSQTLRDFPAYRTMLRDRLGLKPGDFKDDITTYSATLKALAEKRAAGDTQTEGSFRNLFGFDEDNIVARGRKEFDKFYDEGFERNKGIDEIAVKALALVRSLNAFGAALEAVGRKASAALFEKYGVVLGDMTKWVDEHSNEIVATVTEVVNQLVLAYKDIEPIAVPAVHLITKGLDRTAAALDRLLGSPDGKHGGLHAVRYAMDGLAAYIAGKWMLKLLGLLSIGRLLVPFLRTLGPAGVAAAAAYEFFGHVPKAEGDDSYGLDHPGWHPGMPKEKTRAQKDAAAGGTTPPPPAGNGGNPADFAESLDNLHDHDPTGHAKIMEFLRTGGHGMDPATNSWCAAFVGSALHKAGYKDIPQVKGGDVANAYQNWGTTIAAKDVQRGDVVITTRGHRPGQMGGHLAIASGPMVDGKIPVIEGDVRDVKGHGGRHHVGTDEELDRPGLMYRRGIPPEPAPKPESRLQLPADLHSKLAALSSYRRTPNQWSHTNNIGSRKQTTNIQLASTDPHTAASEIARHMKGIHANTMRSLDPIDRFAPTSGTPRDEIKSLRYEKYGRSSV